MPKQGVEIYRLPLGDKRPGVIGGGHSHRSEVLPIAIAGRELVDYDLQNNPRAAGPHRVAVFGGYTHMIEGLRYVVELAHPKMFVIDLLHPGMTLRTKRRMLAQVKADQFDYLIFTGNEPTSGLQAFPPDGWDPLQSRTDVDFRMKVEGQSLSEQEKWNARFRRFSKDLLERRWKRVDLSVGPIYRAIEKG